MNPTSLETQAQEIFYLTKRVIALETALTEQSKQFFERLATVENRVEVLEEARERQIALNSTFIQTGKEYTAQAERKELNPVKKRWFW